MKKIVAQGQNDWVTIAAHWLDEKQARYAAKSIYVPAGETPKPIYHDWELRKPESLNKMQMIQIDDVLDGEKQNIFKQFFQTELPSYASRIEYFDRGQSQADLGILGLGMNGHVAFHEPGLAPNFYSGCVRLQSETLINLGLVSGTWGKTYGAQAFFNCKALLLIVKGEKKKEILLRTLAAATNNSREIPACALLSHQDLTILTDFEL
jgi:6-phosphogluconolactonase/glucosamine-6-phosphate isomerase/deaminase